ncbi:hypothetical protein UlMin_018859 [Ulmus minor]
MSIFLAAQEAKEENSSSQTNASNNSHIPPSRKYLRWLQIGVYAFFVLSGQSAATLLGRLYYEKGGKSKWMGTLKTKTNTTIVISKPPSALKLASVYVFLGLIVAADCYLYSVGLLHLPVSTFTLISASQLVFNALFSFFLNSQKFTPFIINSLVLLTISSVLLVFESSSEENHKSSKAKYAIGFICTVGASAGYGLVLSSTQFAIQKIIKRVTFSVTMDLIVFQSLVATLVGLFASKEWKDLEKVMNVFELGKVSYIMTLAWTAISWQVFNISVVGLIVEVSSLFSNVISVLGLPVVPVLAMFIFHEKMNGLKAIATVLAIWGFISYVYQDFLNSNNSKTENRDSNEETRASQ